MRVNQPTRPFIPSALGYLLPFLISIITVLFILENSGLKAAEELDQELYVMVRIDSKWTRFEGRSSQSNYRYKIEGSATALITGTLNLAKKTSLHKSYSSQNLKVTYSYLENKIDLKPRPKCPKLAWTLTGSGSGTINRTSRLKVNFVRGKPKGISREDGRPDYRFSCSSIPGTISGKVRKSQYHSSGCQEYTQLTRDVNFGRSHIEAFYDSSGNMTGGYSWTGGHAALDFTHIGPHFIKDHRHFDMPVEESGKASERVSWKFSSSPILLILQKEGEDWIDITNPPNTFVQPKIVGEKVELRGAVFPEEKDPQKGQWSISGKFIEDFIVEGERGYTDKLEGEELEKPQVKFHWWDGGQNTIVKYSTVVEGKTIEAKADFAIKEPQIMMEIEVPEGEFVLGKTSKDTKELIYDAGGEPTITFSHKPLPPEFAGETQYVQLVDTSALNEKHKDAFDTCLEFNLQGLDNSYPYSPGPVAKDTPGVEVSYLDLTLSVIHNFEMYLMYKPAREGAIFAPLRVADWKWNVLARRESILKLFDLSGSAINKPPVDKEAYKYPEWTRISPEKIVWYPCK
jgi:hypothetical protein